MKKVVIDFAECVRRKSADSKSIQEETVSASETLELVRAYSQIKSPLDRQIALADLKKIAGAQPG